jgi:DNA polymerase (family X)
VSRLDGELHVDTLEALELAALDGRLAEVPGIGERRAAAIRAEFSERLDHWRIKALTASHAPPVALLLDVDHEHRKKAKAGKLRTIAPKRFNPTGEAWLPVLHTVRGNWRFTSLLQYAKSP